jgi:hypothetical protein
MHVIARRHITSGSPTDLNILNLVLSYLNNPISEIELKNLISIEPILILYDGTIFHLKLKEILKIKTISKTKVHGVYVITNIKTGQQYVGSSSDIYTRLRNYFNSSALNKENRWINNNIAKFGSSKFKVEVYIIKVTDASVSKDQYKNLSLYLEQYYIFTLKSSLNNIKIAGVSPPAS